MGYKENRERGDRCMPQVKTICGQYFYRDDLVFEDQKHNTDLKVFLMGDERLAVRVRAYDKYRVEAWRHQITIRFRLASGYPTEFDKIFYNGWGDYMFYGFARPDWNLIIKWRICDLDVLRAYIGNQINSLGYDEFVRQHFQSNNADDDSDFLFFDVREIPGLTVMDSIHFNGWGNPHTVCEFLEPEDIPLKYREVTV